MSESKVVIQGFNGKMGKLVAKKIEEAPDFKIIGYMEKDENGEVVCSVHEDAFGCDVIIDFSLPEALTVLLSNALQWGTPLVIGTTGYSEEQKSEIHKASREIPIFMASNFSLGANILMKTAAMVAKAYKELGVEVEIEIKEWHHTRKKDAPSGTAKSIKEAILSAAEAADIPIESIREGDIVGNHLVRIKAGQESLEFLHSVKERAAFAEGAVNAARFIIEKPPGFYGMNDLLNI